MSTAAPDDAEIEAIQTAAHDAAVHAITPHRVVNPYPAGSRRADIWGHAFRSAYAAENGY